MICFWLAFCHIIVLDFCRNRCQQNSSKQYRIHKTQATFHVTKEASGMSESHQEDPSASTESLLCQPFSVYINIS